MDWSLLIFVVVTLLFAWRGFRSGFVKSLGRVLAVLAGYTAAILFGGALAGWIEGQFGWQGVVSLGAASLSLFLAAGFGMMLIFALLRRLVFDDDDISTASAVGGGFIGALIGVLLAIAIVWTFAFVRDVTSAEIVEAAAPGERSGIETLASRLVGRAVGAVVDAGSNEPEVARLSGALMSAPAEVVQRTRRLTQSDEFQALLQDPRNRQILDSGKPELVQRLPAFRALVANPDMQALADIAGYTGGDAEAEMARHFTDVWLRSQRVKSNPRVQEIVADREFRAALDSGNPVTLLTNSQLLELADIVFADENAARAAEQGSGKPGEDGLAAEPALIYQWTDSSGRIHYSDKKPGE